MQQPVGEDPTNLIVNYVPTPVSDAELRQLFEQYGELESARVIVDRNTNHPKGYGFVKFKNEASAREAIEKMNGFEIFNKRLKVTPARGPQNALINKATARMNEVQQQQPATPSVAQLPPQPSQGQPPQAFHPPPFAPPPTAGGQTPTYVLVDANGVPIQTMQALPMMPPPPPPPTNTGVIPAPQGQGLPQFAPFRPGMSQPTRSKDPIYSESFNLTVLSSQGGSQYGSIGSSMDQGSK